MSWDRRFDRLSDYNTLCATAAGRLHWVKDSPERRATVQREAQELLDALSTDYRAKMATLQLEYNDWIKSH